MVFFAAVLRITENHCFHCSNFLRVHGHVGIKGRDFNEATPADIASDICAFFYNTFLLIYTNFLCVYSN